MLLNNLSLKWKGALIIIFCLLGLGVQSYFSITNARTAMLEEKQIKLEEIVDSVYDNINTLYALTEEGQLSKEEAKGLTKKLKKKVK